MTDINVDRLFLFNHSPTNSCVFPWKYVVLTLEVRSHRTNRARNNTYFAKSKRCFLISPMIPLPPGQNRFKQFPTLGPEGMDWSRGFPEGMVTGQIEPCIRVLVCLEEKFTSISWRTKHTTNKHGCGSQEFDSDNSFDLYSTRQLIPSAKLANSLNNFTRPF